jgi:Spy/CpxP family protein refolding chaperone
MNRLARILAIAALLAAGAATSAQAGPYGPKGAGAKAGKGKGPMAELNLTPEQKQQIDQIHDAAVKQAEPLRKELGDKMKELQALWTVDKPDKAAIERKHDELNPIHTKLRNLHIDSKLQIHGVLTPEQRTSWSSYHGMPGMPHGMGMMHGGGMGGPHGGACCAGMGTDCPCTQGECVAKQGGECPCPRGAGKAPKPDKK